MAWPRIKNSRSSAQPGTHPHNGVQATVTPAPDAEPPPGLGHNTGVGGARHTVADNSDGYGPVTGDLAADRPRPGRRPRRIRYAHARHGETPAPAVPVEPVGGPPPDVPPPGAPAPDDALPGPVLPGTVLSGTVVTGPVPLDEEPEDYDDTVGLVYEAPRPARAEPARPAPSDEPDEPVPNEGLGIFGDMATTEVPDETPTRDFGQHPPRRAQQAEPPATEPGATRVVPVGAAWNTPIASPPEASDVLEQKKPNPFGLIRGIRRAAQPAEDAGPRVSVRDLPPDVQLRFLRLRITIALVVGVLFFILTRSWEVALTLAILAWIVDTVRRSRSAALYVNGPHPGARRHTSKQLAKMRREGYLALDARPIPHSREIIDHLVVGPTGVYAIDSEKWDPKLPVRTLNGKRLYLGPESQKDRLEHAVWEAAQASEILSAALGTEIVVRPALAIYGPKIPWDIATIRNVDVFTGSALPKYLKRRGRMKEGVVRLTREEVRTIYDTAARSLPDVSASTTTAAPVG